MSHAFPTLTIALAVAVLAACGDDQPVYDGGRVATCLEGRAGTIRVLPGASGPELSGFVDEGSARRAVADGGNSVVGWAGLADVFAREGSDGNAAVQLDFHADHDAAQDAFDDLRTTARKAVEGNVVQLIEGDAYSERQQAIVSDCLAAAAG